jgi:hypothetical protein
MIDRNREPVLHRLVQAVCDDLKAGDLLVSDTVLHEATMVALIRHFSGDTRDAIEGKMKCCAAVVALGTHFETLSALEVMHVQNHARLFLWTATFMTIDGSRCAREWQTAVETAHLDNRRGKVH